MEALCKYYFEPSFWQPFYSLNIFGVVLLTLFWGLIYALFITGVLWEGSTLVECFGWQDPKGFKMGILLLLFVPLWVIFLFLVFGV
jgi:hypothetical protein